MRCRRQELTMFCYAEQRHVGTIVGKGHRRSDEDLVANGDAMVDADAVLDFAAVPDDHPMVYIAALSNRHPFTYAGRLTDLCPVPDQTSRTNHSVGGHVCGGVDISRTHRWASVV